MFMITIVTESGVVPSYFAPDPLMWYSSGSRTGDLFNMETPMKQQTENVSWVVYKMTLRGMESVNAVCEQREWDAMELARPGYHTLVQADIEDETSAERLARGTSGDAKARRQPLPGLSIAAATPPAQAPAQA
jgi:hypothetical protein